MATTYQSDMKARAFVLPTGHKTPRWRWTAYVWPRLHGPYGAMIKCPTTSSYSTPEQAATGCRDTLIKLELIDVRIEISYPRTVNPGGPRGTEPAIDQLRRIR